MPARGVDLPVTPRLPEVLDASSPSPAAALPRVAPARWRVVAAMQHSRERVTWTPV